MSGVYLEGIDQYIKYPEVNKVVVEIFTSEDIQTTQYIFTNLDNYGHGPKIFISNGTMYFYNTTVLYSRGKSYYFDRGVSFKINPLTKYNIEFYTKYDSIKYNNYYIVGLNGPQQTYVVNFYYYRLIEFNMHNGIFGSYNGNSNFFKGQILKIDNTPVTSSFNILGTKYYFIENNIIQIPKNPINNQLNVDYSNLNLEWEIIPIETPSNYIFDVDLQTSEDFSNIIYSVTDYTNTNLQVPSDVVILPDRVYYWRVKTKELDKTVLTSQTYKFTTKSLTFSIYPNNNQTDVKFYEDFYWDINFQDKDKLLYSLYLKKSNEETYMELFLDKPYTSFNYFKTFSQILEMNTDYVLKLVVKYNNLILKTIETTFKTQDIKINSVLNNKINVEKYPILSWYIENDNSELYTYDIYWGENENILFELQTNYTELELSLNQFQSLIEVKQNNTYCLKVIQKYNGLKILENIFSYTTEPLKIISTTPQHGDVNVDPSIDLSWEVNFDGSYFYDVYFYKYGTAQQRVLQNYPFKSVDVRKINNNRKLESETKYVMRIIAKIYNSDGSIKYQTETGNIVFTTQKYVEKTIILKRGYGTPPSGELGEPLFSIDEQKLYIGMGEGQEPVLIQSDNFYVSDKEPIDKNLIWLDNSSTPYKIKIYKDNQWVEITDNFDEIGNMRELLTQEKKTLVGQINEIYIKSSLNIPQFKYNLKNNGRIIELIWKTPYHSGFKSVEIYQSESSQILNKTRNECLIGETKIFEGIGNGQGSVNSLDFNQTLNKTYYFKIFQLINTPEGEYITEGKTLTVEQKDLVPPDIVRNIIIEEGSGKITITFTTPDDEDYKGQVVVMNENHHPVDNNDGKVVQNITRKGVVSTTVSNLLNDKIYYFQIFPYDTSFNFNFDPKQWFHQIPVDVSFTEVSGLKQTVTNNGETIEISWTNPISTNDKFYKGRTVFYSLRDLTSLSYNECLQSNDVFIQQHGVGTGEGHTDGQTISIEPEFYQKQLFIKQFVLYTFNQTDYNTTGNTINIFVKDSTPPNSSTIYLVNTLEKVSKQDITLKIKEPDDSDYYKTLIVKVENSTFFSLLNVKTESDLIDQINNFNQTTNYQYLQEVVKTIFKTDVSKEFVYTIDTNKNYIFKQFQIDSDGNVNITGNELLVNVEINNKQVSNFTQTGYEYGIELKWDDPSETDFPNYGGTVIVRNLTPPQSVNDGEIILNSTNRNQYSTTPFLDTPPLKNTTYYYRQFTYDDQGNYITDQYRIASSYIKVYPPQKVSLKEMIIQKDYVLLSWQDPQDSDWLKTVALRYDELIKTESGLKNQYYNTYLIDKYLSPETTYHYYIRQYDIYNNYSSLHLLQLTPSENQIKPVSLSYNVNKDENSDNTTIDINLEINSTKYSDLKMGLDCYYIIFYAYKDISDYSFYDCFVDNEVYVFIDRTLTTLGAKHQITQGLNYNNDYHFKIFVLYSSTLNDSFLGQSVGTYPTYYVDDGIYFHVDLRDFEPPSKITNLVATTTDNSISFSWNNPPEYDYQGVKIVRNENNIPTDINDGVVVQDLDNTQTTFTDTGLEANKYYFYAFFTYDTRNNINTNSYEYFIGYTTNNKYIVLKNKNSSQVTDFGLEIDFSDLIQDDITYYSFYDKDLNTLNYYIYDVQNKKVHLRIPSIDGNGYFIIQYTNDKQTPSLGSIELVYDYQTDFTDDVVSNYFSNVSSNVSYTIDTLNSELIISDVIDKSFDTIPYDTTKTSNYFILNTNISPTNDYIIKTKTKIKSSTAEEMSYQGIVLLRFDDTVLQSNQIYDINPSNIKISNGDLLCYIDTVSMQGITNLISNNTYSILTIKVFNSQDKIILHGTNETTTIENTQKNSQIDKIQLQIGQRKDVPFQEVAFDNIVIFKTNLDVVIFQK